MRTAHPLQGLGYVLEEVQAVRDLGRLGGAVPRTVRIGFRPIAGNNLDPGMSLAPLQQGASLTIV